MTNPEQITVRVLKYDGAESRCWQANLSRREAGLIVLDAQFEVDVQHELLGEIGRGTRTIEYYWLDRWYNVFRFLETNGETRLFYCNVNMPPVMSEGILTYIDLDIDVLVQPTRSYQILDLEEFEENSARYEYPEQVKAQARAAVDDLISLIEGRRFPFLLR
jgi:protein associated with RNAse G/E